MTTKVMAGQIANTAIYELKDNNPYIVYYSNREYLWKGVQKPVENLLF